MTRLIDVDKLKKAFENLASDDYNEPIWYQQTVFETIDNAPTVEYSFEKAFQKTVCEQRLYCPERPKGKWLVNPHSMVMKCMNCGHEENAKDVGIVDKDKHFCYWCGADMRGEGGNEE